MGKVSPRPFLLAVVSSSERQGRQTGWHTELLFIRMEASLVLDVVLLTFVSAFTGPRHLHALTILSLMASCIVSDCSKRLCGVLNLLSHCFAFWKPSRSFPMEKCALTPSLQTVLSSTIDIYIPSPTTCIHLRYLPTFSTHCTLISSNPLSHRPKSLSFP